MFAISSMVVYYFLCSPVFLCNLKYLLLVLCMTWSSKCVQILSRWPGTVITACFFFFFIAFQFFTRRWNHSHNHSTQRFCSESPINISFHCKIGGIWWNGWQSSNCDPAVVSFSYDTQNGTFRSCGAVVTDSPITHVSPTLSARQRGLILGWRALLICCTLELMAFIFF